jgi:hypothetical protein
MSNAFTPGTPGIPLGAGMMPPMDLAKRAGNIQLMGILSIVFSLCPCCPIVGIVLGIIVIVQAPGLLQTLQQMGGPPDLIGKVNTGKICGIIALVISALGFMATIAANMAGLLQR